ncbi:MAG: hypothetical protein ABSH41_03915 [Syntrophobacteraceae bacterium]|jgi:hypothetical protein
MNGMDHAGWMIVGSIASMVIGAALHWAIRKDNCQNCGIAELKAEISRLCLLVYSLAEKAGMSLKEQLEIQNLERPK